MRTACDLFAGTTRVGQALRTLGLAVHSNDLATYSEALGQAYIVADSTHRPGRGSSAHPGRAVGARRPRRLVHRGVLPPRRGTSSRRTGRGSRRFARRSTGTACRRSSGLCSSPRCSRPPTGSTARPASRWRTSSRGRRARTTTSRCGCRTRSRARRAPSPVSMRTSSRRPSTSTSSTSTLPTTSTRSSPTTTCGRPSMRWDAPETYGVACKRVDCRETRSAYNSEAAGPGRAREAARVAAGAAGSSSRCRTRGSTTPASSPGSSRASATWGGSTSTRSATSGPRSGSTTPRARRWAPSRACGTASPSSLSGPTAPSSRRRRATGLSGLAVRGTPTRKTAVAQAAAASGRNGVAGAPSPVAVRSATPASAAGQSPRPRR